MMQYPATVPMSVAATATGPLSQYVRLHHPAALPMMNEAKITRISRSSEATTVLPPVDRELSALTGHIVCARNHRVISRPAPFS